MSHIRRIHKQCRIFWNRKISYEAKPPNDKLPRSRKKKGTGCRILDILLRVAENLKGQCSLREYSCANNEYLLAHIEQSSNKITTTNRTQVEKIKIKEKLQKEQQNSHCVSSSLTSKKHISGNQSSESSNLINIELTEDGHLQ